MKRTPILLTAAFLLLAPSAHSVEERMRRLCTGAHVEVRARALRLTGSGVERLERIAARYHKATRRRLVVTGGTRTPERQADLMVEKLAHGDDLVALYENRQAVVEVRDAYRDATSKGLSRKRVVHAVRDCIGAQVARGVFVSKHLKSGAADVRSFDMTPAHEAALRAAVSEEPGASLIDERTSAEPHFHLAL
ncbi:MAG: hypothetical protein WCI05_12995 [Myxococcales bacterium]